MSRRAIIAVVCGLVAIFLLEVFAVLAWAQDAYRYQPRISSTDDFSRRQGITLGYGYFSGRVLFLSADTHAKIEVNGTPVSGEMLVGRSTAIITTREAGKHHSYQLFFEGDNDPTGDMGFVVDCGAWVAPHLPVLPETPSYPPCTKANTLPDSRRWPLLDKGKSMQFNLQDHSVVAIRRSRY